MSVSPLCIFCAEDNVLLGELMTQCFVRRGHHVEHASDGREAWARLAPNPSRWDVVVTDHAMPGMNGLRLVAQLRKHGFSGRVVVHSSGVTAEIAAEYRALGVHAVVTKGARPDALIAAVEGPL